jgi:hypothetical protein
MCSLNEPFLKGFSQNNKGPTKLMKNWWVDEDKIFKQGQKAYPHTRVQGTIQNVDSDVEPIIW